MKTFIKSFRAVEYLQVTVISVVLQITWVSDLLTVTGVVIPRGRKHIRIEDESDVDMDQIVILTHADLLVIPMETLLSQGGHHIRRQPVQFGRQVFVLLQIRVGGRTGCLYWNSFQGN